MSQYLLLLMAPAAAVAMVRYRRLPNWLTLGGALAGLGIACLETGVPGIGGAAGGWGVAVIMLLPLALVGLAAPGDVKLAGAIGACAGLSRVGWLGLSLAGVALIVTVVHAIRSGSLLRMAAWGLTAVGLLRMGGDWQAHVLRSAPGRIPLALILSVAALVFLGVQAVHGSW